MTRFEIVADYIRRNTNSICQNWEQEVRANLDAAQERSTLTLIDSLPKYLEKLSLALTSGSESHIHEGKQVTEEYAEKRAEMEEYNLEQIIDEFRILRRVTFRELNNNVYIDNESAERINNFIDQGISHAAQRFVEVSNGKLIEATRAAEAANHAKSAFLANMSHEIRTPLGAIVGFIDLMKRRDLSREELDGYIAIIERNSGQLIRIIDDILDLSKVEAGMLLIEKVQVPLLDCLSEIGDIMGFRARENAIDFKIVTKTPIPDLIVSDPIRLKQILTNIVGNAIKFTDKGSVIVSVTYEDGFIEFEVSDTGPGITPEQLARIFKPFEQAETSTTRKFGGTGLGLILTKRLCEKMGGDLVLKSTEVGKGSVFTARIRVQVPTDAKMIPAREFAYSSRPMPAKFSYPNENTVFSRMRVLLVDDSPDNQSLIKILLNKMGIEVDLAGDGEDGVKKAQRSNYHLILMDVRMPKMDGFEATRVLRQSGYKGPIVALTAHAMKEEREKCFESGCTAFLSKPLHRESLVAILRKYQPAD